MAKVVSNSDLIPIHYMQDGDVAEIVQSSISALEIGTVVQRFGNHIILIGELSDTSYPRLVYASAENDSKVCVKILPKGTLIQL